MHVCTFNHYMVRHTTLQSAVRSVNPGLRKYVYMYACYVRRDMPKADAKTCVSQFVALGIAACQERDGPRLPCFAPMRTVFSRPHREPRFAPVAMRLRSPGLLSLTILIRATAVRRRRGGYER